MKIEKVFEILGEGGGICISRQEDEFGERFLYHHNELDPSDEGLDVKIEVTYETFARAFQQIDNRYPWYILYVETVHESYRGFLIDRLVGKLNRESVSPDYFNNEKDRLERSFNIKLDYSINQKNVGTWSWENMTQN